MKILKLKFRLFFIVYILLCFLKIDRDLYSVQENVHLPHQTYNEEPFLKTSSNSYIITSDFFRFSKSVVKKNVQVNNNLIWHFILLKYNLHIKYLLKFHKSTSIPLSRIVSILYKQNITHKSSYDEEIGLQLFIEHKLQFNG